MPPYFRVAFKMPMASTWADQLPITLIEALRPSAPVVFIGSGLGREALPPLPTARELAEAICARLKIPNAGEPLADLLQYLKNSAHSSRFVVEWLQRELQHGTAQPGGAHHLLLELPVKEYLTTNYDLLLNDAAENISNFRLVDIFDAVSYQIPSLSGVRPAIQGRLHGSFYNTSTIVATTDDYIDNVAHGEQWRDRLEVLLRERTVIFIGYSLRDFTTWNSFLSVRLRWARQMPPHFLVTPAEPHVVRYWEEYGITVVPLPAHAFLIGLHDRLGTLPTQASICSAAVAACCRVLVRDADKVVEEVRVRERYGSTAHAVAKILSEAQR
jgi:hypothetical protein